MTIFARIFAKLRRPRSPALPEVVDLVGGCISPTPQQLLGECLRLARPHRSPDSERWWS